MKIINWLKGFLTGKGEASSKRLVGIVCAGFLCWSLIKSHYSSTHPTDALVYAVAGLAAAALGFTSYEKAIKKNGEEN